MADEDDELDRVMRDINQQAAVDLESRGQNAGGSGAKRKRGGPQEQPQRPQHLNSKQKRKNQEKLQIEALQTGIEKPLGVENKGFKLLSKLGYSGSGGLGVAGVGRGEAIKIDPLDVGRNEKTGLGVKEEALRKEKESVQRQKLTNEEKLRAERNFITSMSCKISQKALEKDIHKAQRIIKVLDEKVGIAQNEFWPREAKEIDASSNGADEPDAGHSEVWMMAHFEDADDGQRRFEEAGSDQEQCKDELLSADRLMECLEYLRTKHSYCLYCGCAFDDDEDLLRHCPGKTADDH